MLFRFISLIILTTMIAGCAVNQHDKQLDAAMIELNKGTLAVDNTHADHQDEIWVSAKKVSIKLGLKNSKWLDELLIINEANDISPQNFVSLMNENVDPIRVTATPIAAKTMGIGSPSGNSKSSSIMLRMKLKNSVRTGLDNITAQMGLSWRVVNNDDRHIEFYKYTEHTFYVKSINTTSDYNTGQNAEDFTSSNSIKGDVWSDLRLMIDGIRTKDDGASVTYSPSISVIVIRDVPDVIQRVSKVIDTLNEIMSRQVVLDINLVRYKNNTGKNAIADIQSAFNTAHGAIALKINGVTAPLVGAGKATAAIINPSSRFNGSTALQALKTSGSTSVLIHRSIITKNNTPVPFSIDASETYLASFRGGSISNGVATAPTATPGTAHSVINIFIYPRIISDSEILLQIDIKLSTVDGFRTILGGSGVGAITIEAPRKTVLSFGQTMSLQDGATLVLTGSSLDKTTKKSSIGIFSASTDIKASHEELVFIITPNIVHKNAGES